MRSFFQKATPAPAGATRRRSADVLRFDAFAGAEDEGNAPDAGESDYCVDDTADDGILTAEEPGNGVELKETDAAPVEGADNGKNQSNTIHQHKRSILSWPEAEIRRSGRRGARPFVNSLGEKEAKYVRIGEKKM